MSMQQFCLRWNNHQPNFISVFSNLLNNETLVDVTLAAEGRHLQAHKVVLSACSTYFQSLFTVNPCQHPIVILKDVKFSDLKIMVDFMYYGEVNVSQDQLPSIIKTAESLKIKGLAEMHTASLTKWPSGGSEPGAGDRGESCSPSPSPLSPSFRRKRLRKSSTGSTSGSGDKPEEMSEITLVATNIVKPEPLIVTQESAEGLRRPLNTSTESQGSIDEDQISIMSNMENSSAATPAQSDGSMQDVSQQSAGNVVHAASGPSGPSQPPAHQGVTICKSIGSISTTTSTSNNNNNNNTISISTTTTTTSNNNNITNTNNTNNSGKRGRFLPRQSRVKRDPESQNSSCGASFLENTGTGSGTGSGTEPRLFLTRSWDERIGATSTITSGSAVPELRLPGSGSGSASGSTPQNLIVSTGGNQTNLLTVPTPTYLVKQHSHPLLPSQTTPADFRGVNNESSSGQNQGNAGGSGGYWIQRQHSNPELLPTRGSSGNNNNNNNNSSNNSSTSPTIVVEPAPVVVSSDLEDVSEDNGNRGGPNTGPGVSQLNPELLTSGSSSSGPLRVKTAELRRSSSSPQQSLMTRENTSDQRLGHCPVQRPGPALGCNHCWNTIDGHGRILRRKTKYHCPECQINLCIVPCFQEFHERQREVSIVRPLPKTGSI